MIEIAIQEDYIKLDSFLKLANFVSSGGEAKLRIAAGEAYVNGAPCMQRGKKLRPGDVVSLGGEEARVKEKI